MISVVAGNHSRSDMNIKFENQSNRQKLPRGIRENIDKIIGSVPREHLRGIDRLRLVDSIKDPRARSTPSRIAALPGLYHPKQGPKLAWIEVALDVLLPKDVPLHKRVLPRQPRSRPVLAPAWD